MRGRAEGSIDRLRSMLARWRRMPVDHLLANVRSEQPIADLRRLRES
ncbi:MAG: hypothetical protein WAR57_12965 [Candidatus Phosphoribacter sp.]|nr:hypothetical protein [Actinomycetales bacterium]